MASQRKMTLGAEALDDVVEQVTQTRWSTAKRAWLANSGAKTLEDGCPYCAVKKTASSNKETPMEK